VDVETGAMMLDLLAALVAPVGLGQLARAVGPLARAATRHKTAIGVMSQLLILIVILKAVSALGDRLAEGTGLPSGGSVLAVALLCVALHLAALAAGFWGGRALRFDRASRLAVAFAGSQKTLPVALLLYETYFPEYPLAVVPALFYHVGQLV